MSDKPIILVAGPISEMDPCQVPFLNVGPPRWEIRNPNATIRPIILSDDPGDE